MKTTAEKIKEEMMKQPSPMYATVVMKDQCGWEVFNGLKPIIDELAFYATLVSFAAIFAWALVNFNKKVR